MHPLLGIALVLGLLACAMGAAKVLPITPELRRKSVHVALGLTCLGFPWWFERAWPVLVLCAASVLALIVLRSKQSSLRSVLHGVSRKSWGEICFPLAVTGLFLLHDNPIPDYVLPLLILTLADALGALVGLRFGRAKYTTDEGFKSLEGSLAFFLTAFLCTFFSLQLGTATGFLETLLIATIIGILIMMIEGFARMGFDNLWIPLVSYLLIQTYLESDAPFLWGRLFLLIGIILFFVFLRRRSYAHDDVLMASAVVLYLIWATAGWALALPPVILAILYSISCPQPDRKKFPAHVMDDLAAVCGVGLIWLLLAVNQGFELYRMPFILSWVAQGGIIFASFMSWRHPQTSRGRIAVGGALVGLAISLPTLLVHSALLTGLAYPLIVGAAAALLLWILEWERTSSTQSPGRALRQFTYGLLLSSVGFTF
jgi:phytol kinase